MKNRIYIAMVDLKFEGKKESRPVGAFKTKKQAKKSFSWVKGTLKSEISSMIKRYWIEGVTLY